MMPLLKHGGSCRNSHVDFKRMENLSKSIAFYPKTLNRKCRIMTVMSYYKIQNYHLCLCRIMKMSYFECPIMEEVE
jgi:hypothetical protein